MPSLELDSLLNIFTFVHPTAKVSPNASLRQGCWIGPNVVIHDNVIVGHYSVIGGSPEHADFYDDVDWKKSHGVILMPGTRIFEFVTVQAGTVRPTILNGARVFNHAHVSHDCHLMPGATLSGSGTIAGFVVMMPSSILSGHSIIHQHCVIGAHAMIGMGTTIRQHVGIAETWAGNPGRQVGFNEVGMSRMNLNIDTANKSFKADFERFKEMSKL